MATLGQNFDFGFHHISPRERMRAIREAGFDDVMLSWDKSPKKGKPDFVTQVALAREFGLAARTAHFPTDQSHTLWEEGEEGEKYISDLCEAIRDYGKYGVYHLVMHMTRGLRTKAPGPVCIDRMNRVLCVAEEENVDIAIENTRFLVYNDYCYKHLVSPRLKFCFDSGHAHCFTPNEDPLALFGDRMVTIHLNDNHGPGPGECDEHLPIGKGTIDFERLFIRLNAYHPESYNLEASYQPEYILRGMTMLKFLKEGHDTLAKHVAKAEKQAVGS